MDCQTTNVPVFQKSGHLNIERKRQTQSLRIWVVRAHQCTHQPLAGLLLRV